MKLMYGDKVFRVSVAGPAKTHATIGLFLGLFGGGMDPKVWTFDKAETKLAAACLGMTHASVAELIVPGRSMIFPIMDGDDFRLFHTWDYAWLQVEKTKSARLVSVCLGRNTVARGEAFVNAMSGARTFEVRQGVEWQKVSGEELIAYLKKNP